MEPDIAPLAQRLAEENNVDWRTLDGTGENGRIVERDVLDYLARVMAGEAAIDPTPEPLPEGMNAWVDDAGNPIEGPPGVAAENDGGAAGPTADVSLDESDDGLLLADDDLITDGGVSGAVVDGSGAAPGDDRPAASRSDAPDLFASDAADAGPSTDGPPDLFEPDDAPEEPSAGAGEPLSGDFDFGGLPGDRPPHAPAAEEHEEAEQIGADSFGGDPRGAAGPGTQGSGEPASDETVWFDIEGETDEEPPPPEAPAEPVLESTPEPVLEAAPEPGSESPAAPPVATPRTATSDVAAASDAWPLARVRTVVRRHVDLGAMLALQRSAGLEAGRDGVPASAVLLLAARRAAGRLDVEAPGVALPAGAEGVRVVVPSGASLGDIADEIDEVERGGAASDAAADLWIADLSGLGIDEAVLDSDRPQLTLGRVLTDDEGDRLNGTLTLASDHAVDHAAAFLARVAELVEDPLRLLA